MSDFHRGDKVFLPAQDWLKNVNKTSNADTVDEKPYDLWKELKIHYHGNVEHQLIGQQVLSNGRVTTWFIIV